MFEDIQLFCRSGQQTAEILPVFCCARLSLGFGDYWVWDQTHALPLQQLIHFYVAIRQAAEHKLNRIDRYDFHKINQQMTILWTRVSATTLVFRVQKKQHGIDELVLQKRICDTMVQDYCLIFYQTVLAQLAQMENASWRAQVEATFHPELTMLPASEPYWTPVRPKNNYSSRSVKHDQFSLYP